ncbi:unnamed protein product [Rotaria sordida]|uniref:TRPM SLOG domain-containing protein n=1 Tax=Rotaria sordida TaxID=392033 RepID=A0A815CAA5_9BILA|nr:unnamed protein product [Rotaria sordida]CAF1280994.1 unnamed protein product [Rotaria sordida]
MTDNVNIAKRDDIESQVGVEIQVNETLANQEEIKRAIQRGLVETAKITNAWVMTNGINHAMNRLIGKGLRTDVSEDDIPCIGLCTWPCSQGHCQLQKKEIKLAHSTQSSDEAHDPEMGRAKHDNKRQESLSWFAKKIRQISKTSTTTNSIPLVIIIK